MLPARAFSPSDLIFCHSPISTSATRATSLSLSSPGSPALHSLFSLPAVLLASVRVTSSRAFSSPCSALAC